LARRRAGGAAAQAAAPGVSKRAVRPAAGGAAGRAPARGVRRPAGRRRREPAEEPSEGWGFLQPKFLLAGGIAALALAVVVAVVAFSGGGEKQPQVQKKQPAVTAKDRSSVSENEKRLARLARAKEALRRVEQEEQANPRSYAYLRALYASILDRYGDLKDFAERIKSKISELEEKQVREAQATLTYLENEVDTLSREEGGYSEAVSLFATVPPEIRGVEAFEERFFTLKKKVEELARWERYLQELKAEALAFAREGRYRVASLIIELGFSEEDFQNTPLWERRQKLIEEFKAAPLAKLLEAEKAAEEKKRRELLAARRKELARRKQEFLAAKSKMKAEPLLGPYDLINWPIRPWHGKWQLSEENGVGVLTVKVDKGKWWLGPNGPYWEDYALVFKIKVTAGKAHFYPRVDPGGVPPFLRRAIPPNVRELKPAITFTPENTEGKWVEVAVDVYGPGDAAVVQLQLKGPEGTENRTLKGSDLKSESSQNEYLDHGSFLFVFEEGCEAQLKEVYLKLIRHRRHGILD